MMFPKPKSAPAGRTGGIQSKFVKNRTNAMKEIETWVKKDAGIKQEASRMSGQLTDNVTEERMLKAKLWELSKERYKFLMQSAYEKKVFTDRIQRKSSALLPRANSATSLRSPCGVDDPLKQRSSSAGEYRTEDASLAGESQVGNNGSGETRAKKRWRNARLALLERLDPTKKSKFNAKSKDKGKEGKDKGDKVSKDKTDTKPKQTHKQKETKESVGATGQDRSDGRAGSGREVKRKVRQRVTPTATPTSFVFPPVDGGGKLEPLRHLLLEDSDRELDRLEREHSGKGRRPGTAKSAKSGMSSPRNVTFNRKIRSTGKDETDAGGRQGGGNGKKPQLSSVVQDIREHQRQNFLNSIGRQKVSGNPHSPGKAGGDEGGQWSKPGSVVGSGPSRPWSASAVPTINAAAFGGRRGVLASRFGMRIESKTEDPRYAHLEKSLAPIPEGHDRQKQLAETADVKALVKNFDALHVPPRNKMFLQAKPKTELKALEYIREQGFAFEV